MNGPVSPTVGVVVPLYNSAATIAETLDSILQQTHRALDIVVVDDGSTDHGPELVRQRMAAEPRPRLVHQPNAGVAAARNHGAAVASGEFLAFVDADDLWAPDKIERQVRALQQGGPAAGFAYCWTATIDAASTVLTLDQRPSFDGQVLRDLCAHNFVGNGSSMLVRRSLFDAIGGFDTSLRAQGAEGCEDYLFCLEAADRAEFRVIPRFLLGYRQLPTSMARNGPRMQRSLGIVLDRMRARHPGYRPETDRCFRGITWWLVRRALRAGQVADAWHMTNQLPPRDRRWLLQSMAAYVRTRVPALPTRRGPAVNTPAHPPHFALLAEVEDHDTLPEDVSALAVRLPPSRTLPPSRPELRHELVDG